MLTDSQKWMLFTFLGVTAALLYLLSPVLMPFVIAAMLAYSGDPLADKLEQWRLSRTQAVLVVFSVMTLLLVVVLLFLIPVLEQQVSNFVKNIPAYVGWLNEKVIPWAQQRFNLDIEPLKGQEIITVVKSHWQKAGSLATVMIGSVSRSGEVIFVWLMNLLLIPVVTFYLLRDWDILVAKVHDLLPRRIAPTASKLARETNTVLGLFVRGQLYVMLALGIIYSIGLWLIDLNLALFIGMMAGLISFVPYLGSIVGITVACITALLQYHDIMYLLPVIIVFAVGQTLEGMVLTPLLVGDKIGLHPVAVIFAVMAGGQLFGFVGVLLALPVASVIMVLLRHVHDLYKDSDFYIEPHQ